MHKLYRKKNKGNLWKGPMKKLSGKYAVKQTNT